MTDAVLGIEWFTEMQPVKSLAAINDRSSHNHRFGVELVRTLLRISLAFLAIGPQIVGSLLVADGLLPFRSRGPSVSPIEVTVGLLLITLGWLIRCLMKRVV